LAARFQTGPGAHPATVYREKASGVWRGPHIPV